MFIYHVVLPDKWETVSKESLYEAESLANEGFIHCSYADQLEGVLERYFAGQPSVRVMKIDAAKLTSPLVSEPSTNDEPYPHVYGPINKDAIVEVEERVIADAPAGHSS
jgi:uncharacterized protein (DUF952 family)